VNRVTELAELRFFAPSVEDGPAPDYRKFLPAGEYIVCAKADDPLVRPARARLIWATNTAAANAALGIRTVLAGSAAGLPYKIDSLAGTMAVKRRLEELYNVDPEFDLAVVNPDQAAGDDQKFSIPAAYFQTVFPRAGLVHTRDPAVALGCHRRHIKYVLEYHDEDFQKQFRNWPILFSERSSCLAVVGITERVRAALIEEGVPAEKIIVLDSGVNSRTALRRDQVAESCRHDLLGYDYQKLVVYSGGMQAERGIGDVLQAAQRMPHVLFAFCGGHEGDLAQWIRASRGMRLANVRLYGYLPHEVVCQLQQAADVLVLSRAANERASITSPLKFFEYLASGTPIVSARISATGRFEAEGCAVDWYEAGRVDSLVEALAKSFNRFNRSQAPHQENVQIGLQHSWEHRQKALFEFIGSPNVKTTF
jgi:glycosyltransferase involved in cell wall biosynthesis